MHANSTTEPAVELTDAELRWPLDATDVMDLAVRIVAGGARATDRQLKHLASECGRCSDEFATKRGELERLLDEQVDEKYSQLLIDQADDFMVTGKSTLDD